MLSRLSQGHAVAVIGATFPLLFPCNQGYQSPIYITSGKEQLAKDFEYISISE